MHKIYDVKEHVMTAVVHLVTPIITQGLRSLDDVKPLERFGIEIRHSILDIGPATIESEYDEALAIPDTINKCVEAERNGAHAIVIDCMGDPGLKPAREVTSVPILGPMETSMHTAAMLGGTYGIVTVVDSVVPMIRNLAKVYGTYEKLGSTRVVNLPVLDIESDIARTHDLLAQESLTAVKEDGVDVIILGCTGFLGCAEAIKSVLDENGLNVPVIDPIPLTVLQAAAITNAGYSHSKRTYAYPTEKEVRGFDLAYKSK